METRIAMKRDAAALVGKDILPQLTDELRRVLAEPDAVLFIGSGLSRWSGLPSWPAMIEELAQFVESTGGAADLVRAEAQRGDYLQAASYAFDKLTQHQIGQFIRAACRLGTANPHEIHKLVVNLGPRCYITTNYDHLIEESLRIWCPDRFYGNPVTNRHFVELAEVVHARAVDFVFKPHGDAGDCESIILTREQYRCLLPQGERHAALESLKMLLASRPIVYLGFGLRDPDFVYLRDLLANTYMGGIRDHYAIMPDVSEAEGDYWRRNYGIHLVSYGTAEHPDGSRDHSSLLGFLEGLRTGRAEGGQPAEYDPTAPEGILALARYAAGLSRNPKATPEFRLRVHADACESQGRRPFLTVDEHHHRTVERFLDDGPSRSLLIGLPGAGKTYAIRQSAARLAERLHQECLAEEFDPGSVVVPIVADLKLYGGSIEDLIDQGLPHFLPFHRLIESFKVRVFLDSFNEMPRRWRESDDYEEEFSRFNARTGHSSLVISSRTTDGLLRLSFPVYKLDWIDEEDVSAELEKRSIALGGPFEREIKWLLQRPFFFKYLVSGEIRLPDASHPLDFHRALFGNLEDAATVRFGKRLGIERVLSITAYEALSSGEEVFGQALLSEHLTALLESDGITDLATGDLMNWLASVSMLVPYAGHRVAFVHQSVTEYLAASELARRYVSDPRVLEDKLRLTRWDQALYLALGLLEKEDADAFLADVMKVDLVLAMRAAKYLEADREDVVTRLLAGIPHDLLEFEPLAWEIASAIKWDLPVSRVHEDSLRNLMRSRGEIGSAALWRLVEMCGSEVKDEFLSLFVDYSADYNFCANNLGPALRPFADEEDIATIAAWADELQERSGTETEESMDGFTDGTAAFLGGMEVSRVRSGLLPADDRVEVPWIRAKILREVARNRHTTAGLELAAELLLRDVRGAEFDLYILARYAPEDSELSWAAVTREHAEKLMYLVKDGSEDWAICALECLCSAKPDLAEAVREMATGLTGMTRAAVLQCVSPTDTGLVAEALEELCRMTEEERASQPIWDPDRVDFDWGGHEELYVRLLRLRDARVTKAVLGGGVPVEPRGLGILSAEPIEWWLDWLVELDSFPDRDWIAEQLGSLLARYLPREQQDELLRELNKPSSKYHHAILEYVLPFRSDISTDDLSEGTLSILLTDLETEGEFSDRDGGHTLGRIASEEFASQELVPRLRDAEGQFASRLRRALRGAGDRHGRRYTKHDEA